MKLTFGFCTIALRLFDDRKTVQVFRKVPKVDPVAAGIDWKFMYTRVSGYSETYRGNHIRYTVLGATGLPNI